MAVDKRATEGFEFAFLEGGGEMGQLIADIDWSNSALGPIPQWPQSLRTALGNILHTTFPMFLFWGEDLICFYNDAYRPSLGVNGKHPAIGKTARDVWEEIWDIIYPMIHRAMTEAKPSWNEDQLVHMYRNGKLEEVYWTYSYSPAFGDDGRVAGVLVTCMETTERVLARMKIEDVVTQRTEELRLAHEALLQSNIYLQQIINSFKEPLQVLEPVIENGEIVDFRYKITNDAYAKYANATPEALKNKNVSAYFPGYLQTSSFIKVAEAFKTGIPDTWEIHYDVDGMDLYNEMSAMRLGDEVVVHFTDFTKMKQLQLELLKKIEELERSNRQLEEFAHVASHDLKEPIRKIQVFTSRLKDILRFQLEERDILAFEKIELATRRMSLLVDDLLLYSHVSQHIPAKEEVDLNETLQSVLEDLELDIQERNAMIRVENLSVVQGYRRQLQQLFQNLLSNSLKYSQKGTPVQIQIRSELVTRRGKKFQLIQLQDNGIGFEQQYAEKIFQLFTRLHGKSEYSGTGVGLSIVKKVVENHQGDISVESKPGEGTRFKVLLPIE